MGYKMNKKENYENIQETIKEADCIEIISCESSGKKDLFGDDIEYQKYTISFSSNFKSLFLDTEIVKQALKENLENIKNSIKHLAKQNISKAKEEAIEETKQILKNLEQKQSNDIENKSDEIENRADILDIR